MGFDGRRWWLALICIAASIPSQAEGMLPCAPTALCALRMARDATFRQAANAADDEKMSAALRLLHWIGEQDRITDPATLTPQFTALRSRLDRWPTPAKTLHLSGLAMALGSAGLITEARAMIGLYPEPMYRMMVEASCMGFYARRNRLNEAFAAANAAGTTEMTQALYAGILQALASTGQPELTLAAGRLGKLDAEQVGGAVAMAHLNAGNQVAARYEAMSISDPMMRKATIGLIALRCQALGSACNAIPIANAWLEQVRNSSGGRFTPDGMAKEAAIKILIERLTEAGDFAGVLALVADMDASKRAGALMAVAPRLRTEADIQTAAPLASGLLRVDREVAQDALNVARVRLGAMSAAQALKSSTRPRATSNHLIQLARELGPAQADKARELLRVAISGDSRIGGPDWSAIIAAQLELGMFTEAKQNLERHQPEPADRAVSLLRMSVALARIGQAPQAARYRTDALASFRSSKQMSQEPATLALLWLDLGEIEQAEVELRSIMRKPVSADKLRNAADLLIQKRVARTDMEAALGFAIVWSAHQGGSPRPFVDIHAQVTRQPKPW